jgi:hypothetical protein
MDWLFGRNWMGHDEWTQGTFSVNPKRIIILCPSQVYDHRDRRPPFAD